MRSEEWRKGGGDGGGGGRGGCWSVEGERNINRVFRENAETGKIV